MTVDARPISRVWPHMFRQINWLELALIVPIFLHVSHFLVHSSLDAASSASILTWQSSRRVFKLVVLKSVVFELVILKSVVLELVVLNSVVSELVVLMSAASKSVVLKSDV